MADLAALQKAEQEALSHWTYVRNIESGCGRDAAEAARVAHEIALLNLNAYLRANG